MLQMRTAFQKYGKFWTQETFTLHGLHLESAWIWVWMHIEACKSTQLTIGFSGESVVSFFLCDYLLCDSSEIWGIMCSTVAVSGEHKSWKWLMSVYSFLPRACSRAWRHLDGAAMWVEAIRCSCWSGLSRAYISEPLICGICSVVSVSPEPHPLQDPQCKQHFLIFHVKTLSIWSSFFLWCWKLNTLCTVGSWAHLAWGEDLAVRAAGSEEILHWDTI